jgi:hypothetical protein
MLDYMPFVRSVWEGVMKFLAAALHSTDETSNG